VKKIAITGPESTGKTTLARQLAAHYETLWVPEFARFYLTFLDRAYTPEDVIEIAKGQQNWENELSKLNPTLLFCDTDLMVAKIWLQFKYHLENEWIESQLKSNTYDFHLLCNIDLPWQDDPLRENPNLQDRQTLYDLYKQELTTLNVPFFEISGNESARLERAKRLIDNYL
jgi:NadR type nicotinamide-nucleotide adenylyltransferase